jgi:tetratricopeptide (TPR) repeat protein
LAVALWLSVAATTAQEPVSAKPDLARQPIQAGDKLAQAKKRAQGEDWEGAARLFLAFFREHPDDSQAAEARFWAGYCLQKQEDHDQAIEVLEPFEEALAGDKWADDALVQLGEAHQGRDELALAMAAWNRLLARHPDSVWREDVLLRLVDLQFHELKDDSACLDACRRALSEIKNRDSTDEPRYLGTYCLNALKRFDEANAWADTHFAPDSAVEAAWRRILNVQRSLIENKDAKVPDTAELVDRDFPDLEQGDRLDLVNKLILVLQRNDREDAARASITAELRRSTGLSEDELGTLFDEFQETYGEEHETEVPSALAALAEDPKLPVMVQVIARERQAKSLRELELSEQAETVLRKALAIETSDFGRFRYGLSLAEVLADNRDDRAAALKVLNELSPGLKRRDLVHQLKARIEELKKESQSDRDLDDRDK